MLALVVGALVVVIVRWLLDRESRLKVVSERVADPAPTQAPAMALVPRELEEEYRRAIEAGDFGLAALLRYRIEWLRLGYPEAIEHGDTKTWREALRSCAQSAHRKRLHRPLSLVERVLYASHAPTRAEFEGWLRTIEAGGGSA